MTGTAGRGPWGLDRPVFVVGPPRSGTTLLQCAAVPPPGPVGADGDPPAGSVVGPPSRPGDRRRGRLRRVLVGVHRHGRLRLPRPRCRRRGGPGARPWGLPGHRRARGDALPRRRPRGASRGSARRPPITPATSAGCSPRSPTRASCGWSATRSPPSPRSSPWTVTGPRTTPGSRPGAGPPGWPTCRAGRTIPGWPWSGSRTWWPTLPRPCGVSVSTSRWTGTTPCSPTRAGTTPTGTGGGTRGDGWTPSAAAPADLSPRALEAIDEVAAGLATSLGYPRPRDRTHGAGRLAFGALRSARTARDAVRSGRNGPER